MKQRTRPRPLFEVRHSPIHGYGVFASRRIRKGTTVIEYLGERVSHAEADSRYEHKDANDNHTFLFTVDAKTVIDGGVDGNDARYINHGCDPNCESTTLAKRIYIEAIRTIQPGEELAYDYQIERDADDAPNVDEIFACRCGAKNCRGTMLVGVRKPETRVPKVKANSKPNSKAKGKTKSKSKTKAKANTKSKSKSKTKAKAKAKGKPKATGNAATGNDKAAGKSNSESKRKSKSKAGFRADPRRRGH